VGWYTRARRDASGFRAEFNRVNTLQEQQILIEAYFDEDKQRGRPLIEEVLDFTQGNQSRACAVLGMSRTTLRKKLAHFQNGAGA
jgi:DNA-binding NtrC family response regulator